MKLEEVVIDYRWIEGRWVATSEQLDNLLVVHQDLITLKAEVPLVIRVLLRAQFGEQ